MRALVPVHLSLQVEPGAIQRLQGPGGFTLLHMACADKALYATAHTALSLMMGGFYHQQRLWGTQGSGSAAVVKLLLDAGADPNARTTSEASTLHIAACSNSADIIRLLVAAGGKARYNVAYKGAGRVLPRCIVHVMFLGVSMSTIAAALCGLTVWLRCSNVVHVVHEQWARVVCKLVGVGSAPCS
jgi:hypothetical protein